MFHIFSQQNIHFLSADVAIKHKEFLRIADSIPQSFTDKKVLLNIIVEGETMCYVVFTM